MYAYLRQIIAGIYSATLRVNATKLSFVVTKINKTVLLFSGSTDFCLKVCSIFMINVQDDLLHKLYSTCFQITETSAFRKRRHVEMHILLCKIGHRKTINCIQKGNQLNGYPQLLNQVICETKENHLRSETSKPWNLTGWV